jgi:hypothetical protein
MPEEWLWDRPTIHAHKGEDESARANIGKEGGKRDVEVFDFGSVIGKLNGKGKGM